MPFHRSERFLSIPRQWRWEFLRRNPEVAVLVSEVIECHHVLVLHNPDLFLPSDPGELDKQWSLVGDTVAQYDRATETLFWTFGIEGVAA